MLGRLAGLRSANRQWRAGWPNLQRATVMHRLLCRFRRCAGDAGLSVIERQDAWRALMLIGTERALRLHLASWMESREVEPNYSPQCPTHTRV
jgi:hypothetical protein